LLATGAVAAAATLPQMMSGSARAQPIRKRKNIEALSQPELEAYERAIQIVKARSDVNPTDPTGYLYWANLHNEFDTSVHTGCSHSSEKFFPWHRQHLADFEAVLQKTDPGTTANLTIPYWDWTKPPKIGTHFPSAFERAASPLFDQRRNRTPPPWDEADIRGLVRESDWNVFAGKPDAAEGFGQFPGTVELGPHNTLHGNISRDMANPGSAAVDPIFWSFHAFIDVVWSRWQRLHVSDERPQPFVDGGALLRFRERSFEVKTTAKTTDYKYEYDYDYTLDGPPIPPPSLEVAANVAVTSPAKRVTPLLAAGESGRSLTLRAEAPAAPAASTILRLAGVTVFRDKTYSLDLYLHPRNVVISSINAEARRAFLIRKITLWKAHHDYKVEVSLRLSPAQLAQLNNGWTVTARSEAILGEEDVGPMMGLEAAPAFSLPATSNLVQGMESQER